MSAAQRDVAGRMRWKYARTFGVPLDLVCSDCEHDGDVTIWLRRVGGTESFDMRDRSVPVWKLGKGMVEP